MNAQPRYRHWRLFAILGALLLPASPAMSQDLGAPTVHWAYASFFGTGWYEIGDAQSAFIAGVAPLWTSGSVAWPDDRGEDAVYRVRVPFTVGVSRLDFSDVPSILDPENFSTTSVGLSADIDVPLTDRLSMRPSVQLNYGTVLGESAYAWTYMGDVRGRYRFGAGDRDWTFVAAAGAVAYDANSGPDDSFTYAMLAAEFTHVLSRFSAADKAALVHWHVAYTDFLNRLAVSSQREQLDEITNYWQVGLAFGRSDGHIKLWFLKFDRLGLAYDVSPSGDLRGIRLVFRSLYDS